MSVESTPWLGGPPPSPDARVRLFCFPFAGGGASAFQGWVGKLPEGVELCRIQLPGRENRFIDPAIDDGSVLIPTLAAELRPFLDVPFAFFGHSMGSMISFELIRLLARENGPQPLHFFPSGHRGPHMRLRRRLWADLPKPELIAELQEIDGIPHELLEHDELLELLLPTVRADLKLYENYKYEPGDPLSCPITAFGGDRDELVNEEELQGWSEHTSAASEYHMLPGGHFYLFEEEELLRRLSDEAAKLLAKA